MKNIVSLCLSIIAVIIAIISLCNACPRTIPLDFDYLGLLIGILSFLVTILIGWQILNAVTIRKDIIKFEKQFDELRDSCQEAVNSVHKNATERIDEGLILIRDMANRNMEALSTLILLRENHGEVQALDSAIEMIVNLKDERGFIYKCISDAINGFVVDIVGFSQNGAVKDTPLIECVRTIPKKRFNLLYSLDFSAIGWSEQEVEGFISRLDYISARYPIPGGVNDCTDKSVKDHAKSESQDK